jgi:excisionase family DNA binding protein
MANGSWTIPGNTASTAHEHAAGERELVNPIEPYIDARQAAAFLHCSPKTVQAWARSGALRAYPVGTGAKKHWLFLKSELDKWIRAGQNHTP